MGSALLASLARRSLRRCAGRQRGSGRGHPGRRPRRRRSRATRPHRPIYWESPASSSPDRSSAASCTTSRASSSRSTITRWPIAPRCSRAWSSTSTCCRWSSRRWSSPGSRGAAACCSACRPCRWCIGGSFVVMALYPSATMLLATQVLRRAADYGLGKPPREMLFTVLNPESKFKSKSLIDTVLQRGSDAVAQWLYLLIAGITLSGIAWMCAGLCVLLLGRHAIAGQGLRESRSDRRAGSPAQAHMNAPVSMLPAQRIDAAGKPHVVSARGVPARRAADGHQCRAGAAQSHRPVVHRPASPPMRWRRWALSTGS